MSVYIDFADADFFPCSIASRLTILHGIMIKKDGRK